MKMEIYDQRLPQEFKNYKKPDETKFKAIRVYRKALKLSKTNLAEKILNKYKPFSLSDDLVFALGIAIAAQRET